MTFHDTFFSPLGKDWCTYYYILLIITFVTLGLSIFLGVSSLFTAKKFNLAGLFKNTLMPIFTNLLLYFLARLSYSICEGALR